MTNKYDVEYEVILQIEYKRYGSWCSTGEPIIERFNAESDKEAIKIAREKKRNQREYNSHGLINVYANMKLNKIEKLLEENCF